VVNINIKIHCEMLPNANKIQFAAVDIHVCEYRIEYKNIICGYEGTCLTCKLTMY